MDLSIAIDFTGSNGSPNYENSLHYIKNGFINNYEMAIRENIKIISMYNKQDKYNVHGFGAKVNGIFQNIFAINRTDDPSIIGIENIISKYKETVNDVVFSGGTYFAMLLKSLKEDRNITIIIIILIIIIIIYL